MAVKKQSEQEVHNTNIFSLKHLNRKQTMARKCTEKCAARAKLFFSNYIYCCCFLPLSLPNFALSFFFLDLIFSFRKL